METVTCTKTLTNDNANANGDGDAGVTRIAPLILRIVELKITKSNILRFSDLTDNIIS